MLRLKIALQYKKKKKKEREAFSQSISLTHQQTQYTRLVYFLIFFFSNGQANCRFISSFCLFTFPSGPQLIICSINRKPTLKICTLNMKTLFSARRDSTHFIRISGFRGDFTAKKDNNNKKITKITWVSDITSICCIVSSFSSFAVLFSFILLYFFFLFLF